MRKEKKDKLSLRLLEAAVLIDTSIELLKKDRRPRIGQLKDCWDKIANVRDEIDFGGRP